MKWEHDRQTVFLEELIERMDSAEASNLLHRLSQAQKEETCMRRAVLMVGMILLISVAGYSYGAVLWNEYQRPEILMQCASGVGLASLLCVIVFLAGWRSYRRHFDKLHQEARNIVLKHIGLEPCPDQVLRAALAGTTGLPRQNR